MQGTVIGGRYKLVSELGTGGFGQTYLAEDLQQPDRSPCVVKQFKPASQDTKFLAIARRLFQTEAETLRKLGQHSQIPHLVDSLEEEREFYLVQEFIDGQPLSDELAEHALSESDVVALLQDVLQVLEFVHGHHVIHRDIKPGNLIRRRSDGKMVLIDFGAVKEIRTQLMSETGQTGFTVGIGTQGYTPSEQLAGKPRYCSDLYALGMTAIHALTGLQPSQIPEDPDTGDLLWQEFADVSIGTAFVLNRMVRMQFSQRYQSAAEAREAIAQLDNLPTDLTELPASWLLEPPTDVKLGPSSNWRSTLKTGIKTVAIAATAVTGLLLGLRQLGWLEPLELIAFDRMTQMHADLPPDPRILVVQIGESDLQRLQRSTPSDQAVAEVLQQLQQHQPSVIGLDLHRDLPQEPGSGSLRQQLQAPNVVTITEIGTSPDTRIPPPPGVPGDRIGFNDIAIDPDGVVRRNLMFATQDGKPLHSFSLRVALQYLADRDITPRNQPTDPDRIQLGRAVLTPLEQTSGGYQKNDAAGYQILLRYRSAADAAPQVSFVDVMAGAIDPALVKGRIVLIGTTAPSAKDLFYTPFSAAEAITHQMPGVIVHAHMVSQILTTAIDGQSLFWFWSDGAEALWVLLWAGAGGVFAWVLRHPVLLGIGSGVALVTLMGITLFIFTQQGWVPVVLPALAFLVSGGAVAAQRTHQVQQQQRLLTQFWQSQSLSSPLNSRR